MVTRLYGSTATRLLVEGLRTGVLDLESILNSGSPLNGGVLVSIPSGDIFRVVNEITEVIDDYEATLFLSVPLSPPA